MQRVQRNYRLYMTIKAGQKIKSILKILLDEYYLGSSDSLDKTFLVENLKKESKLTPEEISEVLNKLIEEKLIVDLRFYDAEVEDNGYVGELSEDAYHITLSENFRNVAVEYDKKLSSLANIEPAQVFALDAREPDLIRGKLVAYSDGSITYDERLLGLRPQLKDLCRLFMASPDRLITADEIKEAIISSQKQSITDFATISKYVSELHNVLKDAYRKEVLINHKKEGWIFKPEVEDS